MAATIRVYVDDDGAAVGKVMRSLAREPEPKYCIRVVTARDFNSDEIFEAANVIIMPGGADLPYCKNLNGRRNARLRNWVRLGPVSTEHQFRTLQMVENRFRMVENYRPLAHRQSRTCPVRNEWRAYRPA